MIASIIVVPVTRAQQKSDATDHTLQAMHDELERSKTRMQIPGLEKPYFIEYRLLDLDVRTITASFGALVSSTTSHNRFMDVNIRVGSYNLDNSNFISGEQFQGFLGSAGQVGVDGDYESLRQDLWLATDQAYKSALDSLARKQGFLRSLSKPPDVADFSQEKPLQRIEPKAVPDWSNRDWEQEAKQASQVLRAYPDLYGNRITYTLVYETYYIMNTEGTEVRTGRSLAAIEAGMETQAPDGVPMHHFYTAYAIHPVDLPSATEVAHQLDTRGKELIAMRTAEPMPAYGGPVLFESRAAAELLAEMLGASVSGSRPPVSMVPMYDQIMESRGGRSEWLGRLNSRVLPVGTSLTDDPLAKDAQGRPLPGSYNVDDEGVLPQAVTLVDNGALKDLLMSRRPGQDFAQSNGHGRALFLGDPHAESSNLFFKSADGVSRTTSRRNSLMSARRTDGSGACWSANWTTP